MRVFRLQYASNFFLHQNESWKQATSLLKVGAANHLALLGNIGIPENQKTKDFVRWCSDNWSSVYCVPGAVELQSKDRLQGLFSKIPSNVHLLDQTELSLPHNLHLLGTPVWTNYAKEIGQLTNLSEEERFFLAKKSPGQLRYWHEEDIEFLVERLRYHSAHFGRTQRIILLTHHLPDKLLLTSSRKSERDVYLYDGAISHLFSESVIGCLSGAGGGSVTGFVGRAKTFCGVNAAFQGLSMVPNPQYRKDMTASFSLDEPLPPDDTVPVIQWSKFLPKPELGIATFSQNAHPILF